MAGKMMVRILFKIYILQCSICQKIYSKDYNVCILAHSSFTFRKNFKIGSWYFKSFRER